MSANPLDQIEDQEDQEDLVVEVPEEELPADEQEAPEPEPAPKAPVEKPKAAPEQVDPAVPTDDDDDASLSEKVRKRINKMTYKQRKAEREAQEYRQQLEALRHERETERKQYEARVGQSDDLIIASREEAIKSEIGRANQDYLDAYRSGDESKLISAQNKMVELQVSQQELLRVKQRRAADVESRQRAESQSQPAAQQPQPQSDDWGQKVATANRLSEDLIAGYAEWWDKDEVLTGSVISIDKRLKAEGKLKPWEPEFYEEVDRRMRQRFPSEFGSAEPAPAAASSSSPRPSQPVAGVSRGAAKGSVSVRLSPEDKAFCVRNGIPPEAYAKELHALQRNKQ